MKYFKYGFRTFSGQLVSNLLIIFELAFLVTALNIVIGNLNSRDILYAPYENIMNNEGYLYIPHYEFLTHDEETGEFIQSEEECLEETLSQLEGDFNAYTIYTCEVESQSERMVRITFVDDRIFEKLSFPLVSGEWKTPENGKFYGVVTPNDQGIADNTAVDWVGGKEITISGVLTEPTYVPSYNFWKAEGNVTMFYAAYSYETAKYIEIITPKSIITPDVLEQNQEYLHMDTQIILECTSDLTPEQKEHNEKVLIETGGELAFFTDISEIKELSDVYLKEDFQKSLPLVVCVWIIAVIGLVCSSAITTLKMLKSYSVLYICGAKWRDCLKINLVSSLITAVIATLISYVNLALGIVKFFANDIGFVFKSNNIIATVILLAVMTGLSVVVPAIMLHSKQPKDVLGEND